MTANQTKQQFRTGQIATRSFYQSAYKSEKLDRNRDWVKHRLEQTTNVKPSILLQNEYDGLHTYLCIYLWFLVDDAGKCEWALFRYHSLFLTLVHCVQMLPFFHVYKFHLFFSFHMFVSGVFPLSLSAYVVGLNSLLSMYLNINPIGIFWFIICMPVCRFLSAWKCVYLSFVYMQKKTTTARKLAFFCKFNQVLVIFAGVCFTFFFYLPFFFILIFHFHFSSIYFIYSLVWVLISRWNINIRVFLDRLLFWMYICAYCVYAKMSQRTNLINWRTSKKT